MNNIHKKNIYGFRKSKIGLTTAILTILFIGVSYTQEAAASNSATTNSIIEENEIYNNVDTSISTQINSEANTREDKETISSEKTNKELVKEQTTTEDNPIPKKHNRQ